MNLNVNFNEKILSGCVNLLVKKVNECATEIVSKHLFII